MNAPPPITRLDRIYRALGYLAVWPALYALGVLLLVSWLLSVHHWALQRRVVFTLLCAHSCYLMDRVKLNDARQDPSDALALPDRVMLFARYAIAIRLVVVCELLAAVFVGATIHPLIAAIPMGALVVVYIYAGRGASPSSPRLKDLPALKAFIIASGHLALSLAVLLGSEHDLLGRIGPLELVSMLGVWTLISGDAVLCDIDDHDADRVYSTMSLPVLLGAGPAWIAALTLIVLGSTLIAVKPESRSIMLGIGSTLIVTTLLTRRNGNQRDFVDARLLPIVLGWILALL